MGKWRPPSNIKVFESIKDDFGNRATDSPMERHLYSRDLGPVPEVIVRPLFQTLPDLVVRPADTDEVALLVKRACSAGIALTPRAGATTVYFDSVPVKGGIVVDLNLLQGVRKLDVGERTVTVGAATTWSDLELYLNERGLACKSLPSSAPAASVGGWLCMMGYGIGSLKYGSLSSQVRSMVVVLPDGRIQKIFRESDPPLEWYAGSEGTLGIITEVELEVRSMTPMRHFLLETPDMEQARAVMERLIKTGIMPYNIHFFDSRLVKTMKTLGYSSLATESGCFVAADYEGTQEELAAVETGMEGFEAPGASCRFHSEDVARHEWDQRFRAIRIKRGGPSVLGAEIWLPLKSLPGYLSEIEEIGNRQGVRFMSYGHVASPEHIVAMTVFFSDETRVFQYLLDLSLVKKIHDAGLRMGGHPYGVGLWNTPYIGRIYGKTMLRKIRDRKATLDPRGIMNPGKVYRAPTLLNPLFFKSAMEIAARGRVLLAGGDNHV